MIRTSGLTILLALLGCTNGGIVDVRGSKLYFSEDYRTIDHHEDLYKYHSFRRNFTNAAAACSREGAELFRPGSADEATAVWGRVVPAGVDVLWIGVHDMHREGYFVTLDGVDLRDTYSNWAPGEPNDNFGAEDCVVLFRDGTFNDATCRTWERFVCRRRIANITQNALCETYDTNYVYSLELDTCYKVHAEAERWKDAVEICKAEESTLVVVGSQAEADYLVALMERHRRKTDARAYTDEDTFLVGFNYSRREDTFVTLEGDRVSSSGYGAWARGQPSGRRLGGLAYSEQCGAARTRDARLDDVPCAAKASFVCERRLSGDVELRPSETFHRPGAVVELPDFK